MIPSQRWCNSKWLILVSFILLEALYFTCDRSQIIVRNPNSARKRITDPSFNHDSKPVQTPLTILSNQNGRSGLHPYVNIVPSTPTEYSVTSDNCVPLPESPSPGVTICPHPLSGDLAISKWLITRNELWERPFIYFTTDVLKLDPNVMVLDLGANIGEYTLWAAAMGRQVVSVEMLVENVQRIQMALALSKLGGHVTIANNALYSDHRVLEITFYKVFREEYVDTSHSKREVKTICMDDLIPLMSGKPVFIKMDIEKSEHFALMSAHRFFREVDVRVMQMEWHKRLPEESTPVLEFMDLHGYACSFNSTVYVPVDPTKIGRNIDVFFMKKSFFNIVE